MTYFNCFFSFLLLMRSFVIVYHIVVRAEERGEQYKETNHPLEIEIRHTLSLVPMFNIPHESIPKYDLIDFLVVTLLRLGKYLFLNIDCDCMFILKGLLTTFNPDVNAISFKPKLNFVLVQE